MVEVTVDEMKAVSGLTAGVLVFLFGASIAAGIVSIHGMNEGFTYGLIGISIIMIVNGIWKVRKLQHTSPTA